MLVGESVEDVPIDAGWGDVNQDLIFPVPVSRLPSLDGIAVGVQLYLSQIQRSCMITEVTEEHVVFDANPPLAGTYYDCSLTLRNVESAPKAFSSVMDKGDDGNNDSENNRHEVITFALGCFWSGELAFMRTPGVVGTKVGYTQGHVPNPTYDDVCGETTGHAEAIMVVYDPDIVSFQKLLTIAINRLGDDVYRIDQVGNDQGSQYRHGIYYHTPDQKVESETMLVRKGKGVQTEVLPACEFYDAEEYHQRYLLKGGQSAKKNAKENIRCYG